MRTPSVLLVVKDLTNSKAFYQDLLNCDILEESSTAIWWRYNNLDFCMFEGENNSVSYEHGSDANATIVFPVSNLHSAKKDLVEKGVELVHETPGKNQWGTYMGFKDPSGIVHELMEFHLDE